MTIQTFNTEQWRIRATQLAKASGKTDAEIAAANRVYLQADFTRAITFAVILETVTSKTGARNATFDEVDKEIITFDESDVFQYLRNAGETLPAGAQAFFTPAGTRLNTEDEIVVTDDNKLAQL